MAELRLLPLGVGDAFSVQHYSSCFVLETGGQWILVDCPHPIRKILREGSIAAGFTLDVGDLQAHNLRDAESSGVGRHEDGPMPDAGNRSEELLYLGGAEDDWELGLLLGRDDALVRAPELKVRDGKPPS